VFDQNNEGKTESQETNWKSWAAGNVAVTNGQGLRRSGDAVAQEAEIIEMLNWDQIQRF